MIYSIGIDLMETDRVKRAIDQWGDSFAAKILADAEMELYKAKQNNIPFLAGRFAAKEAVMKALGDFINNRIPFRNIQILNDPNGRPYVLPDKSISEIIGKKEIKISITHERGMAAAVAIIIGE
jgi:holo-[acyl-carrier protein] synthase